MPVCQRTLSCHQCSNSFTRKAHLERHMQLHSGMTPFRCTICFKRFPRSDSLNRHQATHNPRQRTNTKKEACRSCAIAKSRCDGGDPCDRCMQRQATCEYRLSDQDRDPGFVASQPNNSPPGNILSRTFENRDSEASPSSSLPPVGPSPNVRSTVSQSTYDLQDHANDTSTTNDAAGAQSECMARTANKLSTNTMPWMEPQLSTPYHHDLLTCPYVGTATGPGFHIPAFMQDLDDPLPFSSITDQGVAESPLRIHNSVPAPWLDEDPVFSRDAISSQAAFDDSEALQPVRLSVPFDHHRPDVTFPSMQKVDILILEAEVFGHTSKISLTTYDALRAFYVTIIGHATDFPAAECLQTFVELYFEYFDPQFPLVHRSKIESESSSWILLAAVSAIGSHYSGITHAPAYTSALQWLLRQAIVANMPPIAKMDVSFVQSLFLRDIGLFFSSSRDSQTVLQNERNMLITLCRSRLNDRSFGYAAQLAEHLHQDVEWQTWLAEEERIRLVHCIYMLECFEQVFFDLRPLCKLTDLTHNLPCQDRLWRCTTGNQWDVAIQEPRRESDEDSEGSFIRNIRILTRYVDDKERLEQLSSSTLLGSMLGFGSKSAASGQGTEPTGTPHPVLDKLELACVFSIIDDGIKSTTSEGPEPQGGIICHVIAILRHIPLRLLYSAVGWQVSESEMKLSRLKLNNYLHQHQPKARECLWHAAQIYSALSTHRRSACYSPLSFCIAFNYLLVYDDLCRRSPTKENLVRVDKLKDKSVIAAWIHGEEYKTAHITGIGALHGANSQHRLFSEADKILRSQISWRSIARGLGRCFTQMSQGQQPHFQVDSDN